MWSLLMIFVFVACSFDIYIWKIIAKTSDDEILPYIFFKMVSSPCLSMIDLMLIFVSSIRKWSNFIYLLVFIQVPQQHLFKQLSFSQWIFLTPLLNISWLCMPGFNSKLSMLFHWFLCLFLCQYNIILITITL